MDENEVKKLFEQVEALNARSQELYTKAVTLLEADDAEGAKAKEEEADKLKTKAASIRSLAEKQKATLEEQKALRQPVMPAPLPGGNGGTVVQPTPPTQPDAQAEAVKAINVIRYAGMDDAVKNVIVSLYGGSYFEDRQKQRKAFVHYMTGREHLIDAEGWSLLRKAIPSPEFVENAIKHGLDVPAIKATMVEAVDTLGGYTVPVDLQQDIISRMQGFTVMRGRARIRPTTRDRVQIVKRSGGGDQYIGNVRMVWADETPANVAATETNATFSLEDIPVHTLMGVVPISKNMLEDSFTGIEAGLVEELASARAIAEDNAFLTGDGVGKPQGVLLGGTVPATDVATVNSGAAAALTFDGLIALLFGIASQYKQMPGCGWIANRSTYEAIAKLKDAEGVYLWTEMRGNNAVGNPTTLRGFQTFEQEAMPDIAAGTYPLIFGNLGGYDIVDRLGMTVQRFDVSPGQNILHFEAKFRVGGQVTRGWMLAAQLVSA